MLQRVRLFMDDIPLISITKDAIQTSWSAFLKAQAVVETWSYQFSQRHIWSSKQCLQRWRTSNENWDHHMTVFTENKTVVTYLNIQGDTRSLTLSENLSLPPLVSVVETTLSRKQHKSLERVSSRPVSRRTLTDRVILLTKYIVTEYRPIRLAGLRATFKFLLRDFSLSCLGNGRFVDQPKVLKTSTIRTKINLNAPWWP